MSVPNQFPLTSNSVPPKRETKLQYKPNEAGQVKGHTGSTGRKSSRNVVGMIHAKETGCLTYEEWKELNSKS